nr:Protein fam72a [Polyrhizophydium stewartii]
MASRMSVAAANISAGVRSTPLAPAASSSAPSVRPANAPTSLFDPVPAGAISLTRLTFPPGSQPHDQLYHNFVQSSLQAQQALQSRFANLNTNSAGAGASAAAMAAASHARTGAGTVNPSVHPQFRSKAVCELFCRHCESRMCKRGMRAILLGNTEIELFSTDIPPNGVQLVFDDYLTQNCACRIRDAACLGCGNVVGYHVTQPCERCLDACNNGHFWMFLSDTVRYTERFDASEGDHGPAGRPAHDAADGEGPSSFQRDFGSSALPIQQPRQSSQSFTAQVLCGNVSANILPGDSQKSSVEIPPADTGDATGGTLIHDERGQPVMCPITGLQAKFIDQQTGVPYAIPEALNRIRGVACGDYGWSPLLKCFIHGYSEKPPRDTPPGWLECSVGLPFVAPRNEAPTRGSGSRRIEQ